MVTKVLTLLQSAYFLHIFLQLHADFTDHTAVLLPHLCSEEGAFGACCLSRGWHWVACREGALVRLGAWKQVKRRVRASTKLLENYFFIKIVFKVE